MSAIHEKTPLAPDSAALEDAEEPPYPSPRRDRSACRDAKNLLWIFLLAGALLFLWIDGYKSKGTEEHAKFPENFVWGSATSSYQIEGAADEDGRGPSIWDTWCADDPENCNGDDGSVADDHYHRMESDVRLMKDLGLKAYRFSIAWPRIIPQGKGDLNPKGIAFYNRLIDALIENGIEPWVTLYHWDLPQALYDEYGGWESKEIVQDFATYARACFEAFGDRVKKWITINESWTVAIHGHDEGCNAPGKTVQTGAEPYAVAHHLLLAHARAVRVYRSEFAGRQGGIIGVSNSGDFRYPLRPDRQEDRAAAERAMEFQLAWFADPIWKGNYPKTMRERLGDRLPRFTAEERAEVLGSSDFFGLNHYSSLLAAEPEESQEYGEYWADMHVAFSSDQKWVRNCMGWAVVPDGCRELLKWIDERYDHPTVFITENGSCEDEPDLASALQDYGRRDYYEGYIRACGEAIESGVDLQGYFAWSLMDNFEWQYGYSKRFGICRVDYDTLERTPKLTAIWYRQTIEMNGRNIMK